MKPSLVCCALFAMAAAQASEQRSMEFAGQPRTYRVHVPPGYDGSKPVALVLGFHGGGGTSQTAERTLGFDALADRHGFIAVYPQGLENHWNDGRVGAPFPNTNKNDDVGFVRALVAEVSDLEDRPAAHLLGRQFKRRLHRQPAGLGSIGSLCGDLGGRGHHRPECGGRLRA